MQHRFKRLIALVVIVTLLGIGIAKPRPARASTTSDIIIAFVGFAAYIGVVIVATKLVFKEGDKDNATIEDPLVTYEQNDGSMRVFQRCHQEGGDITLACW